MTEIVLRAGEATLADWRAIYRGAVPKLDPSSAAKIKASAETVEKIVAKGEPVFEGKGWGDIPTCKEAGLPLETFQMPRTVWLPADVPADAVTYYAGLLEKVSKTPEWQEFVTRTAQTAKFMKGKELADFVAKDETANKKVFENEGWVAK